MKKTQEQAISTAQLEYILSEIVLLYDSIAQGLVFENVLSLTANSKQLPANFK